ncbi:hypothetical protein [Bosea sp. ANAM02]|uniref:hypothetical protein n=1 Tax=Bosea sp. ANAM02 TaxID=2020412 RepID=UPI00140F3296|nr:hypothetical protein [Bosea sp. ANAM02]BCB21990.1 hypothetical protein OCUBac02_48840 [Bosea sp. ANAM02]
MIDFAALLAEKRARMMPEERERFDAAVAAREAIEATEHPIPAVFEVLVWKRPSGLAALKAGQQALPERAVDHTYERDVRIRIEPRDNGAREVIQFIGAVTGHEAFELTPDLCAGLASDAGGTWSICAGTPNRYDSCTIQVADVLDYLRDRRPELVGGLPLRP